MSSDDQFWNARPRMRSETARIVLDGQMVIWPPDSGPGTIDPAGTVVAQYMTGDATIAELAEDFSEAAGLDLRAARGHVGLLSAKLSSAGVIDPLPVPPAELGAEKNSVDDAVTELTVEEPETPQDFADELAEALGIDDTAKLIVEELPDGRKRVSTQFVLSSSATDERARLAAEVLAGERSLAELAPADSCLGYKLRVGTDVEVITVQIDRLTMSVRCDHPLVAEALRHRFAESLSSDLGGAVTAFVVAPLEGDGPCRVFDALGSRRGRPRSVADTVDLVGHLLTERASARTGDRTLINWSALVRGRVAVLVDPRVSGVPRLGAAARLAGFEFADFRSSLRSDSWVNLATGIGTCDHLDRVEVAGILVGADFAAGHPGPDSFEALLAGAVLEDHDARVQMLHAMTSLISRATLRSAKSSDAYEIVGLVEAIFSTRVAS